MPVPRKFSDEMRDRAKRMVREAWRQEPGLSINAACKRMFSRAKYAAARLRISFSTSSRRLSSRNSASSARSFQVNRPPVLPSSAAAGAIQFAGTTPRPANPSRSPRPVARHGGRARLRDVGAPAGEGAGTNDILPGGPGPPQVTCPVQGANLMGPACDRDTPRAVTPIAGQLAVRPAGPPCRRTRGLHRPTTTWSGRVVGRPRSVMDRSPD